MRDTAVSRVAVPARAASPRRVVRARGALLALCSLPMALFFLIPLAALLLRASPADVLANLVDRQVAQAIQLSIGTTLVTLALTVVAGTPLEFSGGALTVPRGPGLGVELDRDALAKLHEQYLACGLRNRDDTGSMQRIVPSYERKSPRW